MGKIVALGEIMLRLSPQGFDRFSQTKQFNAFYGGSEANASVSLACLGKEVSYVTKLPTNDIAQCAINEIRKYGVDTSNIVRGGNRMGLYFFEYGQSKRTSKIVFDRKDSAIAKAEPSDFDWDKIFEGAEWFHFSGITPALSESCMKITLDAVKAAKKKGLTVSIDLNYRSTLWSEEDYGKAMKEILPYCDVTLGSKEESELALGLPQKSGKSSEEIMKAMVETYGLKYSTAIVRKVLGPEEIEGWTASLYDGEKLYKAKEYDIKVVDEIGGGDAFAASFIYAASSNMSKQDIIEFATAGSCLKYTMMGDANLSSVDEVLRLMKNGSGQLSR